MASANPEERGQPSRGVTSQPEFAEDSVLGLSAVVVSKEHDYDYRPSPGQYDKTFYIVLKKINTAVSCILKKGLNNVFFPSRTSHRHLRKVLDRNIIAGDLFF